MEGRQKRLGTNKDVYFFLKKSMSAAYFIVCQTSLEESFLDFQYGSSGTQTTAGIKFVKEVFVKEVPRGQPSMSGFVTAKCL